MRRGKAVRVRGSVWYAALCKRCRRQEGCRVAVDLPGEVVAKGRRAAMRWRARSVWRCAASGSVCRAECRGCYVQWAQKQLGRHAVAAEERGVW